MNIGSPKTAVMFAGVDALEVAGQREQVMVLPEVLARVEESDRLVRKFEGDGLGIGNNRSLKDFILNDEKAFHANLPLKAFACAAVQVGLYDRYDAAFGKPDYLVGCSLGDTARTVCSGAVTFEEMIYGTYLFNTVGQRIKGGAIVRVSTASPRLSQNEVNEIEKFGLHLAVHQTPRHFLVSGSAQLLEKWVKEVALTKGYRVAPLYGSPLHSSGMNLALDAVKSAFENARPGPIRVPMVSAVLGKVIESEAELREDIEKNMTSAVYWWQTYSWMIEKLGVRKFVNIGPGQTLLHFSDRIPMPNYSITTVDSLELSSPVIPRALRQAPAESSPLKKSETLGFSVSGGL